MGEPASETVTDSPSGWVAEHVRRYLETDGADGHDWNGVPTLLLTTRGRTSGLWRRTALIYGRAGDEPQADLVIVASQGGAPDDPSWYKNLQADPVVRLQVGAERYDARARTATAEERARLWPAMAAIWPAYDDYQTKTDREIPVVVLSR